MEKASVKLIFTSISEQITLILENFGFQGPHSYKTSIFEHFNFEVFQFFEDINIGISQSVVTVLYKPKLSSDIELYHKGIVQQLINVEALLLEFTTELMSKLSLGDAQWRPRPGDQQRIRRTMKHLMLYIGANICNRKQIMLRSNLTQKYFCFI